MLHVGQVTELAKNFVLSMFPDALAIRLEEVEIVEHENAWYVTFSFIPPGPNFAPITQALTGKNGRIYKSVKLDAIDGTVKSMKIRTVE